MKSLLFIILFSSPCYALSPPPINFTHEEIETPDGVIIVEFDGKTMTARKKEAGSTLIPILFLMSGIFWFVLLGYFFGFINVLIVTAVIALSVHILINNKIKK